MFVKHRRQLQNTELTKNKSWAIVQSLLRYDFALLAKSDTDMCIHIHTILCDQAINPKLYLMLQTLSEKGYELVSGGTDNHLVLVNLKNKVETVDSYPTILQM